MTDTPRTSERSLKGAGGKKAPSQGKGRKKKNGKRGREGGKRVTLKRLKKAKRRKILTCPGRNIWEKRVQRRKRSGLFEWWGEPGCTKPPPNKEKR